MISPDSASFTFICETSESCLPNWSVKLPGMCWISSTAPGKSLGKYGTNFISVAGPPVDEAITTMGNFVAPLGTAAASDERPFWPFCLSSEDRGDGSERGNDEATSC